MISSTPIVPVYRALTIVGTVLTNDAEGTSHKLTTDTTLRDEVEVVYDLV